MWKDSVPSIRSYNHWRNKLKLLEVGNNSFFMILWINIIKNAHSAECSLQFDVIAIKTTIRVLEISKKEPQTLVKPSKKAIAKSEAVLCKNLVKFWRCQWINFGTKWDRIKDIWESELVGWDIKKSVVLII